MKKLRERILADGGLQYKEGVNAAYHMLRVPSVEYDQIEFDLCQDRHRYDINMGVLNKTTN